MASIVRDHACRRHGIAWLALTAALAVHVADEAAHDFLSLYNPIAAAIRAALPFLPLPTFTVTSWLASLAVAVAVLGALSTAAFRGARWAVPASAVYAGVMTVNGLLHLTGSLLLGRLLPGVYSSPLLLVAAVWLVVAARGVRRPPV
jgi:hypothetical protein